MLSPKLDRILRMHARFICGGAEINPDTSLALLGVDSLDMFELIVRIEDDFDLAIPAERITPETFATPATIWQLLCEIDPALVGSQS